MFVNKTLLLGKINNAFKRFYNKGNNTLKPCFLIITILLFKVGFIFSKTIRLCFFEPNFRLNIMF
jgi:hypothetical protein